MAARMTEQTVAVRTCRDGDVIDVDGGIQIKVKRIQGRRATIVVTAPTGVNIVTASSLIETGGLLADNNDG